MKEIIVALVGLLIAYKHEIWTGCKWIGGAILYSCFVGAIPMPQPEAPKWKRVGFAILNGSAGNISRMLAAFGHSFTSIALIIRGGGSQHKED